MTAPASIAPPPAARGSNPLPVVKPSKPAKPGYQRAIEVGLRSLHIAAMGLVLGGIAMGGTFETMRGAILATLATGLLLFVTAVRWGCLSFTQGAGAALLLKLALLGVAYVFFEDARLPWYLAATIVTSIGSHMPSAWRHYPVLERLRSLVGLGVRTA